MSPTPLLNALNDAHNAMGKAADELTAYGRDDKATEMRGAMAMLGQWIVDIMEENRA